MSGRRVQVCVFVRPKKMTAGRAITARTLNRHRAPGRFLDHKQIEALKHDSDTVAIRERPFGHAEQKDATLREIGSMTALMDDVLASDAKTTAVPQLFPRIGWPCHFGILVAVLVALWASGRLVMVCDAVLSLGLGLGRFALKVAELMLQTGVEKCEMLRNRFDLLCCDVAERWCNNYDMLCQQRCSYKYSYV